MSYSIPILVLVIWSSLIIWSSLNTKMSYCLFAYWLLVVVLSLVVHQCPTATCCSGLRSRLICYLKWWFVAAGSIISQDGFRSTLRSWIWVWNELSGLGRIRKEDGGWFCSRTLASSCKGGKKERTDNACLTNQSLFDVIILADANVTFYRLQWCPFRPN